MDELRYVTEVRPIELNWFLWKHFKMETDALYIGPRELFKQFKLEVEVLDCPNGSLSGKFWAESFDAKLSCLPHHARNSNN